MVGLKRLMKGKKKKKEFNDWGAKENMSQLQFDHHYFTEVCTWQTFKCWKANFALFCYLSLHNGLSVGAPKLMHKSTETHSFHNIYIYTHTHTEQSKRLLILSDDHPHRFTATWSHCKVRSLQLDALALWKLLLPSKPERSFSSVHPQPDRYGVSPLSDCACLTHDYWSFEDQRSFTELILSTIFLVCAFRSPSPSFELFGGRLLML